MYIRHRIILPFMFKYNRNAIDSSITNICIDISVLYKMHYVCKNNNKQLIANKFVILLNTVSILRQRYVVSFLIWWMQSKLLCAKNKCHSLSLSKLIYPNTTDAYMTLKFTSFIPRFIRSQANLCWRRQRMRRNVIDCLNMYYSFWKLAMLQKKYCENLYTPIY